MAKENKERANRIKKEEGVRLMGQNQQEGEGKRKIEQERAGKEKEGEKKIYEKKMCWWGSARIRQEHEGEKDGVGKGGSRKGSKKEKLK